MKIKKGAKTDECSTPLTPVTPTGFLSFGSASTGAGYAKGYVNVVRVEKLEKVMSDLKREWNEKKISDNIMHAKSREEHDTILNEKKRDRISITGMTARGPAPVNPGRDEWQAWFRQEVMEALIWMDVDVGKKIVFVNHLGKWSNTKRFGTGDELPPAEVKFNTKEAADTIRKRFVEGKKAGKVTGCLYITSCVTLATRVRVEIMWGMANQYATSKGQMYVSAHDSTPKLHVKQAGTLRDSYALNFGEALLRYGKDLTIDHLESAYRRAGQSFGRLLEEYFVVLSDKMRPPVKRYDNRDNRGTTSASTATRPPIASSTATRPPSTIPDVPSHAVPKPSESGGGKKRKGKHLDKGEREKKMRMKIKIDKARKSKKSGKKRVEEK